MRSVLCTHIGRYAEAESLFKHALASREKVLGPDHGPDHPDVAWSLNSLGVLYADEGKYAKAEPLYRRALAIREKVLGPEHPDVVTCLENYASLLRAMDRPREAESLEARVRPSGSNASRTS
jgi:tetratricopeptide (TPR) repeat protein